MRECPEFKNKIDVLSLKKKDLIELLEEYHSKCLNKQTTFSYKEPKQKIVSIALKVGAIISSINFKSSESSSTSYLGETSFSTSISPVFGISADFKLSQINERLSVELGLMYQIEKLISEDRVSVSEFTDNIKAEFKTAYVRIPFSLKYSFSKKKFRPFISAGGGLGFIQEQTNLRQTFDLLDARVSSREAIEGGLRKLEQTFFVGLGAYYSLSTKTGLIFNLNYERSTGFSSIQSLSSKINRFYLTTGFSF